MGGMTIEDRVEEIVETLIVNGAIGDLTERGEVEVRKLLSNHLRHTNDASELAIDGVPQTEWHRFAVRWLLDGTLILYRDGKRVTKAWSLSLTVQSPADEHGGNANTD
jgi:hypothetical protein